MTWRSWTIAALVCSGAWAPLFAQGNSAMLGLARIEAVSRKAGAPVVVGTGFVVSRNGSSAYVVTAQHVTGEAATISVYFAAGPDAAPATARVVAGDGKLDLVTLLAGPVPAAVQALPLQLRQEGAG